MAEPTVRAALGLGWRAAARHAWLAPVGLLVAIARIGLALPALAFAWYVVGLAAIRSFGQDPRPGRVLAGVLQALTAPRTAAVLLGLWASAALLAAAMRAAWLAGALPTLGPTLAGEEPAGPLFARGVAYGFPRLAATALLAWLLELLGAAFAGTVVAGSLAIGWRARDLRAGLGVVAGVAAVVATALACAAAVSLLLGILADSALGRAALRGEGPARALGRAALRVARRPGAFVLVGLAVAVSGALAAGTIQGFAGVATGFARGRVGWLLIGPDLVVAVVAALVAAWVELWRLGALAALACADG